MTGTGEMADWIEAKTEMFAAMREARWNLSDVLAEALARLSAEQVRDITAGMKAAAAGSVGAGEDGTVTP